MCVACVLLFESFEGLCRERERSGRDGAGSVLRKEAWGKVMRMSKGCGFRSC